MSKKTIPMVTARRLCLYKRFLESLEEKQISTTSSPNISKNTGIPPYQVRKDINTIAEKATIPGKGYSVYALIDIINDRLGLNQHRKAILIGAGSVGTLIVNFLSAGILKYDIVAAFDIAPEKIGKKIGSVTVYSMSELSSIIERNKVEIGILTVPACAAQTTANLLVQAKIKAILNFSSRFLQIPKSVIQREIDFGIEMDILSYLLTLRPSTNYDTKGTLTTMEEEEN